MLREETQKSHVLSVPLRTGCRWHGRQTGSDEQPTSRFSKNSLFFFFSYLSLKVFLKPVIWSMPFLTSSFDVMF